MVDTKAKSRSQMIREHLASVPASERGPTAVVKALKEKGITVSYQLVSQIKSGMTKGRKKSAKRGTKANAKKGSFFSDNSSWVIAKNLLKSVGGDLSTAKKNLEIVAKLMS